MRKQYFFIVVSIVVYWPVGFFSGRPTGLLTIEGGSTTKKPDFFQSTKKYFLNFQDLKSDILGPDGTR